MKKKTKFFLEIFIAAFIAFFSLFGMPIICGYLSFELFMFLFNNKILSIVLGIIISFSYEWALIQTATMYKKRKININFSRKAKTL